jgi:hypothetical protein
VLGAFMFLCILWTFNCGGIEALNIDFITPIHISVNKGFIYLFIYLMFNIEAKALDIEIKMLPLRDMKCIPGKVSFRKRQKKRFLLAAKIVFIRSILNL